MEQFITSIPTTFVGWIATIIVLVVAGFYLLSRIRQADMKILRDANVDLRASNEDNRKQILEMKIEIHTLIGKVEILEKRNKTLEDLVITALKQYFFENPKVAVGMQKAVMS